jgi:lysophospholipase L1-like esterase
MRRTTSFFVLLLLLVASVLAVPGSAASQSTRYPSSMSALGDSMTRAFNAAGWYRDEPERSWSTGTSTTVNSQYRRLVAPKPALLGNNHNLARSGAKMSALATQASASVERKAQYVTIEMGANDACTSTAAGMTSVATFRTQLTSAMNVLAAQRPRPKVLVASIPDIKRLWEIAKGNLAARTAWDLGNICQSMLANPLSTAEADVTRRATVDQRVKAYNATLADVCGQYAFCKYDGGAVHAYRFTLTHVSPWDYFHPSTAGQNKLAEVTYQAGYWPN